MKVKNNYNECLTNLACSIKKYFGLDYHHQTLKYIDDLLETKKPQNVVTILFDGLGSNIMDKVLPADSFLIKHRMKSITTVFPATTVAATTSILTGLNPVESGMLGWNMYFKDIDKTITTFFGSEKGDDTETPLQEAIKYKEENMITKSIMEEINEKGKYQGYGLFLFGENSYKDIEEIFAGIKELCSNNKKKYIYAYDIEPDCSMHDYGTLCAETRELIINRNNLVEKLCDDLENTIVFVVADHGHITVDNIHLEDYSDIVDCLDKDTSLEPRAVNFFIKKDKHEIFKKLFKKYFQNYFDLYEKEDIIESKLFGDGVENKIFRDALGDYLAIAKTDKTLLYHGNHELKSQHAGYTDDEIYVPLIVIDKTNVKKFV